MHLYNGHRQVEFTLTKKRNRFHLRFTEPFSLHNPILAHYFTIIDFFSETTTFSKGIPLRGEYTGPITPSIRASGNPYSGVSETIIPGTGNQLETA